MVVCHLENNQNFDMTVRTNFRPQEDILILFEYKIKNIKT